MKKYIFFLFLISIVTPSNGQIGKNIGKRAKRKTERKAEKKINNKIDDGIDKGFDKIDDLISKKKKKKEAADEVDLLADPDAYEIAAEMMEEAEKKQINFVGSLEFQVKSIEDNIMIDSNTISVGILKDKIAIKTYRPKIGEIRSIIDLKEKVLITLIDNKGERKGVKRSLERNPKANKPNFSSVQKTAEAAIITDLLCRKYQIINPDKSFMELWLSTDLEFNYYAFLHRLDRKSKNLFPSITNAVEGTPIKQVVFDTEGNPTHHFQINKILEDEIDTAMFSTSGYEIMDITFSYD